MKVTGHPVMTLWLKTDADVTSRTEDVAPDGATRSYQMLGRLRASHRTLAQGPYDYLGQPWMTHKIANAKLVPAGQAVELKFALLPMSYIFKAGHKVRVTLTFADQQRRQDPAPGDRTDGRLDAFGNYSTACVAPLAKETGANL